MASAEREPITGVWRCGAEPPAGSMCRAPGQGAKAAKPPEAESILPLDHPNEGQNLPL